MKKVKIYLVIFPAAYLLMFVVPSCVPESESMDGAGQTLVKYFPEDQFALVALDAKETPQEFTLFEIRKNSPGSQAYNSATTVDLIMDADSSMTNEYNRLNGTDFIPMPASLYSTSPAVSDNMITITFNNGGFAKSLVVKVPSAASFDFTKSYMLAFRFEVSGEGVFTKSLCDTIYRQIMAKNKYDGVYEVNANNPMVDVVNPAFTGYYPFVYKLVTTGSNTCEIYESENDYPLHPFTGATGAWSYYGAFCPMLTFSDSGDGIIVSADNIFGPDAGANKRDCILDPSGINKWEVINNKKTIRIKYIMIQKANTSLTDPWYRTFFDETWTYIGPR